MAGLAELLERAPDDVTIGELKWALTRLPTKAAMLSGRYGRYYKVALVKPAPVYEGVSVLREHKIHMKTLTFDLARVGIPDIPISYEWRVIG